MEDVKQQAGTRVTLAAVAREAKVSVTTVSDILLRGADSRYNAKTCRRIQKLASEMGYAPSRAAQQLAKGRSGEVGLLLTRTLSNPYWARALSDIEAELRKKSFRLQLTVVDALDDEAVRLLRELVGSRVEAVIVGPIYSSERLDLIRQALPKDFPICTFGANLGEFDMVGVDDQSSARQAAQHLVDMGHRRINYLCAPAVDFSKLNPVREVLASVGMAFDPEWLCVHDDNGRFDEIHKVCAGFVRKWKAADPATRPTAMVCHSDSVALTAIAACHEAGIRIPEELSLVGCDNLPESPYLVPALTSIDCRIGEQMAAAVDLAIARTRQPGRSREVRIFAPELIVRQSVRNLATEEEQ